MYLISIYCHKSTFIHICCVEFAPTIFTIRLIDAIVVLSNKASLSQEGHTTWRSYETPANRDAGHPGSRRADRPRLRRRDEQCHRQRCRQPERDGVERVSRAGFAGPWRPNGHPATDRNAPADADTVWRALPGALPYLYTVARQLNAHAGVGQRDRTPLYRLPTSPIPYFCPVETCSAKSFSLSKRRTHPKLLRSFADCSRRVWSKESEWIPVTIDDVIRS